ncbi:hypothetical protein [Gluconobacter japonicus]|uniref:hypothetical protein n=1 Tax=Gluconobacter japonicus TaxID=376620 RepID=UPI000782BF2E|nr:hypothetical protein [Gluconobacter japonicus]KXV20057.1 hypothetical protein AD935_13390 [Gluconobacter japonicus]
MPWLFPQSVLEIPRDLSVSVREEHDVQRPHQTKHKRAFVCRDTAGITPPIHGHPSNGLGTGDDPDRPHSCTQTVGNPRAVVLEIVPGPPGNLIPGIRENTVLQSRFTDLWDFILSRKLAPLQFPLE